MIMMCKGKVSQNPSNTKLRNCLDRKNIFIVVTILNIPTRNPIDLKIEWKVSHIRSKNVLMEVWFKTISYLLGDFHFSDYGKYGIR